MKSVITLASICHNSTVAACCGRPCTHSLDCVVESVFTARWCAKRLYAHILCRLAVRPSARPSVTFRYLDHIGWNFENYFTAD